MSFETIVIGAGPGGTATAALLASRGQEVLLLEASGKIGGRARTYAGDEFATLAELVAEFEGAGAKVLNKQDPQLEEAVAAGALRGYHFELGEHGIAGSHLLRTPYLAQLVGADIEIRPNVGAWWETGDALHEIVKGRPWPGMTDAG